MATLIEGTICKLVKKTTFACALNTPGVHTVWTTFALETGVHFAVDSARGEAKQQYGESVLEGLHGGYKCFAATGKGTFMFWYLIKALSGKVHV